MQNAPKKIALVTGANKRDDVRYLAIDLEDSATIATAEQAIDADFGRLDVLFNNAGIVREGDRLLQLAVLMQ
jgi:NAD(P)-dependent dehydrogenase (short-subunit alcohol dehydrogenase family)